MAAKKKNRKTKKKKSKSAASPKAPRRARKAIKARTGKKSLKRRPSRTTISKKSKARRTKPEIDAVAEIERETRNIGVTRASRPRLSDFQGLSRAEDVDSESVEELVEEGNIAESGVVEGVEEADNQDEREVHTRELPEDDVPEEYLEKD